MIVVIFRSQIFEWNCYWLHSILYAMWYTEIFHFPCPTLKKGITVFLHMIRGQWSLNCVVGFMEIFRPKMFFPYFPQCDSWTISLHAYHTTIICQYLCVIMAQFSTLLWGESMACGVSICEETELKKSHAAVPLGHHCHNWNYTRLYQYNSCFPHGNTL